MSGFIHLSANVSPKATIGENCYIWHEAQIREGVTIGSESIIGKGAYVDFGVTVGARCKLQNGVFVYHGATLEEGVMLGPGVMLLNDKTPRAITPDGRLKSADDWQVSPTHISYGAGIGGGSIILPGVTVGRWAIVGSGSVVTRDVPDYGLVYGNPARLHGFVCPCGQRLQLVEQMTESVELACPQCQQHITVTTKTYRSAINHE
ncbi:acyltransferase [Anaerolineales bacterium HSG6]|nr:acyltransferase [Anaerolineales bacterium HSG6]MDM8532341.1 acyltransferase [Anaerolineales bacterium HSG25]